MNPFSPRLHLSSATAQVCLLGGLLLLTAAQSAEGRDPVVQRTYEAAATSAKRNIDMRSISKWVSLLKSPDRSKRAEAFRNLKAQTGVTLDYEPDGDWREAQQKWHRYRDWLQLATSVKLSRILQHPVENSPKRGRAILFLGGQSPHPAFLPLLRAIAENEQEELRAARSGAIVAISRIPHDGLIEYLIEQLDKEGIGYYAFEQLTQLTDSGIGTDRKNWDLLKRRYEQWWAEHKDEFEYDRSKALQFF